MANRLELVVPRVSSEEHTFAIVRCDETPAVEHSGMIFAAILAAVTEWVDTTQEGKDAYSRSAADFNIGDLSMEAYDDGELGCILAKHGIINLDITTFVQNIRQSNWTYDRYLVDETKFTSE
jgi:hypothetical protein